MGARQSGIVEYAQLSSNPDTPSTGYASLFPKTDNHWYAKNPDGSVTNVTLYTAALTSDAQTQINSKAARIRLSELGILSDADVSFGSSTFGTDQTSAIQTILNTASASAPLYLIWDCKVSTTGLQIKSYTTILAMEGCGAILRDSSDNYLLRTYGWTQPFTTIENYNITIDGGIWNGNGFRGGVEKQIRNNEPLGVITGFNLVNVQNLILRNLTILNTRTFAIFGANWERAYIDNLNVDQGATPFINQDGIDLVGRAYNITITNCRFRCGDERLIFVANPAQETYGFVTPYNGADGDQIGIRIDNFFAEGPGKLFRFNCSANKIQDVYVSNVHGESETYFLLVENGDNLAGSFPLEPGNGNFKNLVFENIHVEVPSNYATDYLPDFTGCIMLSADIELITFKNITRNNLTIDRPTFCIGNPYSVGFTIKDFVIDGYNVWEESATAADFPHIRLMDNTTVFGLRISNSKIVHDTDSGCSIVQVDAGSTLYNLHMNNVAGHNITNFLNNDGTVAIISATLIRHTGNTTDPTFNTAGTINKIVASNYHGTEVLGGTFTEQKGDAFSSGGGQWTDVSGGINYAGGKVGINNSAAPAQLSVKKSDGTAYGTPYEVARFSNSTTDVPTYSHTLSILSGGDALYGAVGFNVLAVDGSLNVTKDNSGRSAGLFAVINNTSNYSNFVYRSAPASGVAQVDLWGSNSSGQFFMNTGSNQFVFPSTQAAAGQVLTDVAGDGVLSWQDGGSGGSSEWAIDSTSGIKYTFNQNALVNATVSNTNTGASAQARFQVTSDMGSALFGIKSVAGTAYGAIGGGNAYIYTSSGDFTHMVESGALKLAVGGNSESIRFAKESSINYLNFGGSSGTSDYGIRNNGGVMEWKSSGGSWAEFGGGGGGSSQWDNISGGIEYTASANSALSAIVRNSSTGTSAAASLRVQNDANELLLIGKLGSNYSGSGLLTASTGYIYSSNNISVLSSSAPIAFSTDAGTTTALLISPTTNSITAASLAGSGDRMVVASSTGVLSTQAIPGGGGGGGVWGSITGTLTAQSDLVAALDTKAPLITPTFTTNITTPRVISSGSAPTGTLGPNLTGTCVITGNDFAGRITTVITSGGASYPTLEEFAIVSFTGAYGSIPRVVFSPSNSAAANLGALYMKDASTGGFKIAKTTSGTSVATTYIWDYVVVQ